MPAVGYGAALPTAASRVVARADLLRSLRRPIFALSVTTSVCSFVAQGIAFVSLPFYFQEVIGVSAIATGLLMTPWPAMTAVLAPIAGWLSDRYPAGILGGIGLAVCGTGFVSLASLPA